MGVIKPHKPDISSTVCRWIVGMIGQSDIHTDIFKVHSIRSAVTSKASRIRVSMTEIIKGASGHLVQLLKNFIIRK